MKTRFLKTAFLLTLVGSILCASHGLAAEYDISEKIASEFAAETNYFLTSASIDGLNHLCIYTDVDLVYFTNPLTAIILTVDPNTGIVTQGTPFAVNPTYGIIQEVIQVDADHFLCVYSGENGGTWGYGCAVVLTVDTVTKTITKGATTYFGDSTGPWPSVASPIGLSPIDSTHFLCTYTNTNDPTGAAHAWSMVLAINTSDYSVTNVYEHELGPAPAADVASCSIDGYHQLVSYLYDASAYDYHERTIVLAIDPVTYTISEETYLDWPDNDYGIEMNCEQIDATHYLMAYTEYESPDDVELTSEIRIVEVVPTGPGTWDITLHPSLRFDLEDCGDFYDIEPLDDSYFLCSYRDTWYDEVTMTSHWDGYAVVFDVDTTADTVEEIFRRKFSVNPIYPHLTKIDDTHFLTTYAQYDSATFMSACWSCMLDVNPTLMANVETVPETGGSVNFSLDAGDDNAGRNYLIMGGVTGTDPGYDLPGGAATLPVNFDLFTEFFVFPLLNTSIFSNFLGTLGAEGHGTAQFNMPPAPGYAGQSMYYAFCLGWPWEFASNAIEVEIVP